MASTSICGKEAAIAAPQAVAIAAASRDFLTKRISVSLSKKCFGEYSHARRHRQKLAENSEHMKFVQFRIELLTLVSYAKLLSESNAHNLSRFVKTVRVLDGNQKCKFPH